VPKGGQNLLEPAKLDGAILAGPHNSNFARLAAELAAAGGLRQVDSAAELTTAVGALLEQPATRAAMIAAARNYAAGQAGVLDRVMETLAPLLRESFPGAR
jgi:3-deoxy-D-manno-octulosonic-acid transferase